MKKFLFAITLVLGVFIAQAQVYNLKSSVGNNLDTITDAGTKNLSGAVVGQGSNASIQAFFTKLTGTVAGTAYLDGSLDGVNYGQISATTYTVTNVATQSTLWVLANHPVSYYRIRVVGSGTSTYTIKAQVLRRTR